MAIKKITNQKDAIVQKPQGFLVKDLNIPGTATLPELIAFLNANPPVTMEFDPGIVTEVGTVNSAANINNISENCLYSTIGTRITAGIYENYSLDIIDLDAFWQNADAGAFDIQLLLSVDITNTQSSPRIIIDTVEYTLKKQIAGVWQNLAIGDLESGQIYLIRIDQLNKNAEILNTKNYDLQKQIDDIVANYYTKSEVYNKTESDNNYVPKGVWQDATLNPNVSTFTIWGFARPIQYKIEGNNVYFRGEFAFAYNPATPPINVEYNLFSCSGLNILSEITFMIGSYEFSTDSPKIPFVGNINSGSVSFHFKTNTYGEENNSRRLVFDGLVLSLD